MRPLVGNCKAIARRDGAMAEQAPDTVLRAAHVRPTLEEIATFRKIMPNWPVADIRAARHAGHRY